MLRLKLTMLGLLMCGAGVLAAQAEPGPGDLIPRDGTLAYMTSDRPDALYRLFGRDAQGGWKLRSFLQTEMEESLSEESPEEGERARTIFDYVFDSYEALETVEIGLVDVTADGPKYLLHLKTRQDQSIEIAPEFLSEFAAEEQTYQGVKYIQYRAEEPRDGVDSEGNKEPARPAFGQGMTRFYVAKAPTGVLVSNFETTIRNSIDLLKSDDFAEALSQRSEFEDWVNSREPHDFSVFVIGREIQRAIERAMPSEDQAGVDTEGIYREIDDWLQFREYRYIVLDFDYDESARGVTVAGSFKTRRETKMLGKLAIEPAEFKLLKYVPEGAMVTAGVQLGNAKQTFENLKELAYDAEKWVREIEEGMGGSTPPARPDEEDGPDDEMKSVAPGNMLRILKQLEEANDDGEEGEASQSEVDKALEEVKAMLAEYGTSLNEVLSVLGTEIVVFGKPDGDRASAIAYGAPGMGDIMGSMDFGVAVAIKDVAKAKGIIATARENDPEGAFRGFTEVDYQGKTLNVSSENPFGYAFTDDALLIAIAMGVQDEDVTNSIIASLRGMIDGATSTTTGADEFVKSGSKFIEFDVGAMSRLSNELNDGHAKRLDRYAQPPLSDAPTKFLTDMTVAMRLKEYKDGVEVAVRLAGLPDFGQLLEDDANPIFSRGNGNGNAYAYAEENLRGLGRSMRTRVESGKTVDLNAMIKDGDIRTGTLQVPFDSRWDGDLETLGWTTLAQVVRDSDGELPSWVDADAAKMIEINEKKGFSSIKLAQGDIASWISDYKAGFIVAYQASADTLGGHFVLYADGQVGWLHGDVFADARALNKKGEPVPAEDAWEDTPPPEDDKGKDEGDRIKEDDPWFPGGK